MVAYPDRTVFFGDYFRVGVDSPGAMDCGFQALNERIGGFGINREWIVAVVLTTSKIRPFEAEPRCLSLRAAGSED